MIGKVIVSDRHLSALLALLQLGIFSSCATAPTTPVPAVTTYTGVKATVYVYMNDYIYSERTQKKYEHSITVTATDSERAEGYLDLGELTAYGKTILPLKFHLPPVPLRIGSQDTTAWYITDLVWYDGSVSATYKEHLYPENDPAFPGFSKELRLTVSSEPRGARLYANGRFVGTVPESGLAVSFPLGPKHYQQGYLLGDTLTLVRFGYIPESFQPRLDVAKGERFNKYDAERYQLVILKRDPLVPAQLLNPPPYAQQSSPKYDESRARAYEDTKAEYEQCLVAWESAMRNCDNTGLETDVINGVAAGSDWATFLDVLGSAAKQGAARELQVAKERLERAKARLQALDWKE